MATFPYTIITDGTITITMQDGAGGVPAYPLLRSDWAPGVASLRNDMAAGRGPYNLVRERFELEVRGSTATQVLSRLNDLKRVIDNAELWANGKAFTPVLLHHSPAGGTTSSAASPMRCAVWGWAGEMQVGRWDRIGMDLAVPVTMEIWRGGVWLHVDENGNTSVNNGLVGSVVLTNRTAYSPVNLTVSNIMNNTGATFYGEPIIAVASPFVANGIYATAASPAWSGGAWTQVNDAARFAVNINVLRYTPASTALSTSANATTTMGASWVCAAVYASCRNNSATTNFWVRVNLSNAVSAPPPTLIPANALTPRYYFLGMYTFGTAGVGTGNVSVSVQASAASGSLDMDNIVVVETGQIGCQVLRLYNGTGATRAPTIQHGALERPFPVVAVGTGTRLGYTGDAAIYTIMGGHRFILLATGGASTADRWCWESGGAIISNTWTVARTTGYAWPE